MKHYLRFYIFVFLYQPSLSFIIGLNSHILFLILSTPIIFNLLVKKDRRILSVLKKKPLASTIILFLIATLYASIRSAMAGASLLTIMTTVAQGLLPILYLIMALLTNISLSDIGYTKNQKIELVLNTALVQSLIAILMLIFPPLKQLAINIYYGAGAKENIYIISNRIYGICDGDYTYGLQISHAILAITSLVYAYYNKRKRFYLYVPLLLSVTMLNGRTGLLIFIVGFLIFIIKELFSKKGLSKSLTILACSFCLSFGIIKLLPIVIPSSYGLIKHALNDFSENLAGESGTETGRYREMYVFPNDAQLVFGEGTRIVGKKGSAVGVNVSSDIGIINDLYLGGLIYTTLIYIAFYRLLLISHSSSKDQFTTTLLLLLAISALLANLKGEFVRQPLLQTNFMLLISIPLYNSLNEKESSDD